MALAVTVKGGYWEDYASGTMTLEDEDGTKRRIAEMLNREAFRELKELMLTLNGAAAGSTAAATYSRVSVGESDGTFNSILNGLRTIDTVTAVNRATTAADKTNIDGTILAFPMAPTYVANGDGNPRDLEGG